MATQANVTSTEALEAFRSNLIVFLTKAKRALDDATDEVKRTRQWLQQDQRMNLEGEHRRRTKQLQQAQQELMTVKLGAHKESALAIRQMAVAKAQRDLAEVEGKLRKLKGWSQNFDYQLRPDGEADGQAEPVAQRIAQGDRVSRQPAKNAGCLYGIGRIPDPLPERGAVPQPNRRRRPDLRVRPEAAQARLH